MTAPTDVGKWALIGALAALATVGGSLAVVIALMWIVDRFGGLTVVFVVAALVGAVAGADYRLYCNRKGGKP
jgi:hypothetical protein